MLALYMLPLWRQQLRTRCGKGGASIAACQRPHANSGDNFSGAPRGVVVRRLPQSKDVVGDRVLVPPPDLGDELPHPATLPSSANYEHALEFSAIKYISHLQTALKTRFRLSTERVIRAALETTEAALAERESRSIEGQAFVWSI